jgi:hypothetical protein
MELNREIAHYVVRFFDPDFACDFNIEKQN